MENSNDFQAGNEFARAGFLTELSLSPDHSRNNGKFKTRTLFLIEPKCSGIQNAIFA